jgi:hypothetical protein
MRALSPEDASLLRQSLPEAPLVEVPLAQEPALDDLARRGLMKRSETVDKVEWVTTTRGRLLLAASEVP